MENKKAKNVLLALMGVLIVAEIAIRLATIQYTTVSAIAQMISLIFVSLYGFVLYKKPHGNMLKYAMLVFAFTNILGSSYLLLAGAKAHNVVKILASAAVCYCAGRLNRIEQNKIIMPVIGLVFLGTSIYGAYLTYANSPDKVILMFACFNFTITYVTLMIAYFVRFEEHKLAGIMDYPKN